MKISSNIEILIKVFFDNYDRVYDIKSFDTREYLNVVRTINTSNNYNIIKKLLTKYYLFFKCLYIFQP